MATELVLLSEVPVITEVHHHAYARLKVAGEMFEWLDNQFATLHDESRRHILTVHTLMMTHDAREATTALVNPPEAFRLWSEIMMPSSNTEKGRTVAGAMAVRVGGLIREGV